MKIGNFLVLLLLALVGLGFLLNDSFYTHSELSTANDTVVSLQTEVDQVKQQKAQQEQDLQTLLNQNKSLQTQNQDLQSRNSAFELQVLSLSAEANHLQTENARLQQISTQSTCEAISPSDPTLTRFISLNNPSSQAVTLGLLVPMLLAGSGVAVYGLYHYNHKQAHPGTYVVRISQHELDLLIRHRRTG